MIKIIRAKKRHISAIGQLWLEFMRFHQDIDPIFTPRDGALPGFVEHPLRRFMKSKDGLVLVALEGERAVGFSLSEIKGPMEGYKLDRFGYVDTLSYHGKLPPPGSRRKNTRRDYEVVSFKKY